MTRNAAIASRYAQALFLAAVRKDAVEEVGRDMGLSLGLDAAVRQRFQQFLEAPHITTESKVKLIEEVIRPRVHPLFAEFIRLLLAKKRYFRMQDIADEFGRLVEEHRGIVRARVFSAVPLHTAELEDLVAQLEARLKKQVHVVPVVEPALIGGVVVRVGDRIIDTSIRTQLERMREQLLAARG